MTKRVSTKISDSTSTIREMLLNQMKDLSSGEGNLEKAKAITELSAQAIYTTRLELENKRLELELGKADKEVKQWMERDFSNIQTIKA